MVSSEPALLAVAADRREFAGLARSGARPLDVGARWAAEIRLGGVRVVLVAGGPGEANAAAAVEAAAERFRLTAILSTGYAGGLSPDLRVGNILIADRVAREGADVEYAVSLPERSATALARHGSLVTVDRVIETADEKVRLHRSGFAAVDMEAAAVAEQARGRGLPFYAVRVISDAADEDLEFDFNSARRADGAFSGWSIVAQAGLSRKRWRKLFELKRNGEEASRALARFLDACRFPSEVQP